MAKQRRAAENVHGRAVIQFSQDRDGVQLKGYPVGATMIIKEEAEKIEERKTRSEEGPDVRAP